MDKATRNKAVIANGAHFKGKIKNAPVIEINGTVEADLKADKVTIGSGGKFVGAVNADLVVISGQYDGNMDAGSIWATATAQIAGKIQYKTLQMDRGAALNCRVIHNWSPEKAKTRKTNNKETSAGDADLEDDDQIAGGSAAKTFSKKVDVSAAPDPLPDEAKKVKNSDFELLAVMAKQKSAVGEEPARGRRLGIFGFGSRSTKLPDTSG
jgi:cytoskeletal protein CcmA (bactofilin family)